MALSVRSDLQGRRALHPREIPRLRVPALRAKAKARDASLGMTVSRLRIEADGGQVAKHGSRA